MSNKNYSKMYKSANATAPQEVSEIAAPETPVEPEVIAAPEVPVEPEKEAATIRAIVVNCAKLNVREEPAPNAKAITVIDASSEVIICGKEGFGNYYKVCTASGAEGYCVKDFLELK